MARCGKCGKTLPADNAAFCPYCGEIFQNGAKREKEENGETFDPDDIKNNKIFAAASYISILVIIPFVFARKSSYAMFHARQGITLLIIKTLLSSLKILIDLMFIAWSGTVISTVLKAVLLILSLISLLWTIFAFAGKAKKLPFAEKITRSFF